MNVPLLIAFRYLFARKTRNIINWISAISVGGIAIGSAAMIIIISIYNGFSAMIEQNIQRTDFPYLLQSKTEKFFDSPIDGEGLLEDKVVICYDGKQTIALAKGMDSANGVYISEDLAYSLGYRPQFSEPLNLLYPGENTRISLLNPMGSMSSLETRVTKIIGKSADGSYPVIVLPMKLMRRLTGYETAVTGVGLSDSVKLDGFVCLDSVRQHPTLFKMLRYEKTAIFAILVCVILIVCLNILNSQKMLRIEKREDMQTLTALGISPSQAKRVFALQGWLIAGLGLAIGLVLSIVFCLVQMKTGLVKMPGGGPYPLDLRAVDVVVCALSILVLGGPYPLDLRAVDVVVCALSILVLGGGISETTR